MVSIYFDWYVAVAYIDGILLEYVNQQENTTLMDVRYYNLLHLRVTDERAFFAITRYVVLSQYTVYCTSSGQ